MDFPTNSGHPVKVYYHPGRSSNGQNTTYLHPEFKAEAIKLVTEQGYSVAEAARQFPAQLPKVVVESGAHSLIEPSHNTHNIRGCRYCGCCGSFFTFHPGLEAGLGILTTTLTGAGRIVIID